MGRYVSFSIDPQIKKSMSTYNKITGEEKLNYSVININDLFIENGRADLLSKIIYGMSALWFIIVNKNVQYRDPFTLLVKDFDIKDADGKKFLKIPVLDMQNPELTSVNNVNNSVNNTLDL